LELTKGFGFEETPAVVALGELRELAFVPLEIVGTTMPTVGTETMVKVGSVECDISG
jgi:hypothetical protein